MAIAFNRGTAWKDDDLRVNISLQKRFCTRWHTLRQHPITCHHKFNSLMSQALRELYMHTLTPQTMWHWRHGSFPGEPSILKRHIFMWGALLNCLSNPAELHRRSCYKDNRSIRQSKKVQYAEDICQQMMWNALNMSEIHSKGIYKATLMILHDSVLRGQSELFLIRRPWRLDVRMLLSKGTILPICKTLWADNMTTLCGMIYKAYTIFYSIILQLRQLLQKT